MTESAPPPGTQVVRLPRPLQIAWELLRDSFQEWGKDGGAQLGAALAFYTLISLAPLLIVVIMIAGLVFGNDAAQGEIVSQISGLIGEEGAAAIEGLIANAARPEDGVIPTLLGLAVLIFGATNVFYQLQEALNRIWGAPKRSNSAIVGVLWARFIALATVLGAGVLLIVSLVISAGISALGKYAESVLPFAESLLQILNFGIGLVILSLTFALVFRVLPNANLRWRYALVGGLFTGVMFSLGKFLIGWYLGQRAPGSLFGAAGGLVVILIWVYYSGQIFLLGAEFTKVFHRRFAIADGDDSLLEPDDQEDAQRKASVVRSSGPG